ncbi:MAG: hypothetical protein PHX34_00740 [Candidatus Shapirobacteria bacterium]|nr:hypothetical protein [Candidatus Shapirobacteria bacterium]
MNEIPKWVGISGSWRLTSPKIENDVRTEVDKIISDGNGIVTGGALNVDYQATDEVLKLGKLNQLKIFIPVTLKLFINHYHTRAKEGIVTEKQADDVIKQLTTIKKLNPKSLIENSSNIIVDRETYYQRNSEVVKASDELLAFQVNESRGTQDTIDKAKRKGIPVKVFSYSL